jgi:hypothetical protein
MVSLRTESLTTIHWVAIVLAAVTGVTHLFLGVSFFPFPLGISFLLAGLGFFGAAALVLVNYRRRVLYAVGVPYTAVQIVLWYVLNFANGAKAFPGDVGTLGAVDKIAQVGLIVVLVVLLRRSA